MWTLNFRVAKGWKKKKLIYIWSKIQTVGIEPMTFYVDNKRDYPYIIPAHADNI